MLLRLFTVFLVFLLLGCTGEEDTLKTKRDLANLQEQIYEIERAQAELKEELLAKARDLDRKMEDRTAQADMSNDMSTVKSRLEQAEALIYDLESKLVELRKTTAQVVLSSNPVASEPADPTDRPAGTTVGEGTDPASTDPNQPVTISGEVVEQQFNQALLDYNRGKYEVAVVGFGDLLANFPTSPYTEPSHYYLGVCFFQQKNYQKARDNFFQITSRFPKGDYIKQAKLYEGQCYYYLNQHSRAIITLRELIDDYPGTQESDLARQFLKKTGYER